MTTRRLSAHALEDLRSRLSPRDRELLADLEAHRYLTTGQIARLLFARPNGQTAIRACVRVLFRLRERGLLERLERQIGGLHAGSAAFVWRLTRSGQRLVLLGSERTYQRTLHLPSLDYLAHVLAIAEVHVQLIELPRAGRLELLTAELEPACWRRYVGAEGASQTLKPDLIAVTASGDYEDHWMVEVDRGREGMRVLLHKCAQYTAYAATGREQAARGVFPYVLWLVPSEERGARLLREAHADPAIDESLLRVATPGSLSDVLTGTSRPPSGTTDAAATASLARLLAGGAHERF